MANLIQMSEQLKAVPDEWLSQQIENPSGMVPPYLALSELNRRKTLRSKMAQAPASTVAQDVTAPPPAMAGTDMLNNRQPQPQMPQQSPAGVPTPMPAGLAASAPARPQGASAPQRMAGGGLVGGFVEGDQPPGYDRMMPWWMRIPPEIQERLRQRQQVRGMAGGGLTSTLRFPYYGQPQQDDDDLDMEVDEEGNRIVRVGGRTLKFPAPTPMKFPEYRDTTPVDVEIPDLAKVLGQVREITKRPEGPTALDRRMEALEAQRGEIRKPTRGDWLIDAGLGMMASRSPHGLQALGEAGLGATQNFRQRQQQALKDTMGLEERLAQFEAAREEMAERARREDLGLAKELGHQQYGASVVKAQTQAQREASRQRWDLARAEAEAKQNEALYRLDTGLNEKILGHWLDPKQPKNIDPLSPEGLAAAAIRDENQAKVNARYRVGRTGTDYSFAGRPLPDAQIDTVARAMIKDQAKKWGVGGEDTWQTYLGRLQNKLGDEVLAGERYMDDPTMAEVLANDRNRFAIAQRIKALSFDASKGRDKDWLNEVKRYVQTGKDAELAKGTGKPRPGITFGFGAQAPSDRRAKVFEPSILTPF